MITNARKINTKSRIFLLIGRDFPNFNVQIHEEISNRIKNQFDGVNIGQAYSLLLPFVMSKHDKSTFGTVQFQLDILFFTNLPPLWVLGLCLGPAMHFVSLFCVARLGVQMTVSCIWPFNHAAPCKTWLGSFGIPFVLNPLGLGGF